MRLDNRTTITNFIPTMNRHNALLRAARGVQPIDRVMVIAAILWLGALIGAAAFGNQF
ncbi:hypothetical protein Bcep22_gp29 [Burkholderia phage Bcep22]|uniref:Uncharacterized protein n=1 Tax=Burkholderia phage Bcep22 TaxID=2883944 RepID=Q6V7R4_9CAUD|nr:hypothetical protein Bcep22_gp29 [Burkholderia phage Bcep22]AAQ54962.1 hypothetical protein Bcep22_gp29 [Burkholderia phage Bcep22]